MSTEQNKANVRRIFEEGINKQDLGVLREVISPTYVNHNMPAPAPGAEGLIQVVGMFQQAFPDFNVTVEGVIGEGDLVASRGYFTGTHRGDFMGIPATGKPINVGYHDLWRVAGGKCEENWVILDMMTLMQQLGVIPAPEGATA
jgi:predicted ester cyclase